MARKEGIYIRKTDNKEYKFLGETDCKHANKKGKFHITKVIVGGEFVNVFKSSSGYYLGDLDGNMKYDKVALLRENNGSDKYFTLSLETFADMYKRKEKVIAARD